MHNCRGSYIYSWSCTLVQEHLISTLQPLLVQCTCVHKSRLKGPKTITKIFSLKSPTKNPKEPIWARGPRYGQHCYILHYYSKMYFVCSQI